MKQYYSLPMYYGASHILFKLAKQLRFAPTEAESKLWELLTSEEFLPYKFRRQHPIANYIADFYCHSQKLVIETDGGVHEKKEQKQYDKFHDSEMQQFEITVLRFSNQEVLEEIERVKQKIKVTIQQKKSGC